jgi:DNA-binding NarL/FixJ family response regulator
MEKQRAQRLRFLLVDDNAMYRENLASVVQAQVRFEVVGQAGLLEEALSQAFLLRPDVVLLAARLPDGRGSSAVEAILAEHPDCRIIMLAGHNDDQDLFSAIRAGALGYLLKNMPGANLVAALNAVLEGETILFGASGRYGYAEMPATARRECRLDRLSRGELQVLQEMVLGASNAEIARRLYVPEQTVTGHVSHILEKLNLPDRHEAARLARQNGLRIA